MVVGNPYNLPVLEQYLTANLPSPVDFPLGWMIYLLDGVGGVHINTGALTWTPAFVANTAISIGAGAAATPSYTFSTDTNSGMYSTGADQVGIITGGVATQGLQINAVGQLMGQAGAAATPTFTFGGDPNSGLYSLGADTLALTVGGVGTNGLAITTTGVGIGLVAPATKFDVQLNDAATNAVVNVVTIGHNTSGLAANGFGSAIVFNLETTTTIDSPAALIAASWTDATHATRDGKLTLSVTDHAGTYPCIIMDSLGSVARLGFFGSAAAARPATYTITNLSADRTFDANACADLEICDVLGTLITDLASIGLLVVA